LEKYCFEGFIGFDSYTFFTNKVDLLVVSNSCIKFHALKSLSNIFSLNFICP